MIYDVLNLKGGGGVREGEGGGVREERVEVLGKERVEVLGKERVEVLGKEREVVWDVPEAYPHDWHVFLIVV